jgi:hypothetical protein
MNVLFKSMKTNTDSEVKRGEEEEDRVKGKLVGAGRNKFAAADGGPHHTRRVLSWLLLSLYLPII